MRDQGGSQAGPAFGFHKSKAGLRRLGPQIARHAGRKPTPAHRQDHQIGRTAKLVKNFHRDRGLTFDDVFIIKRRQEMRAFLGTEFL